MTLKLQLGPEDLDLLRRVQGYRTDETILGDSFELAFATWLGLGARDWVVDRLMGRRDGHRDYDFLAGKWKRKVDTKCSFWVTDVGGLMLSFPPEPDVAYVQGRLTHTLEDVKDGKRAQFAVLGWRPGADAFAFQPHPDTRKPWCSLGHLCNPVSIHAWVNKHPNDRLNAHWFDTKEVGGGDE